MGHVVKGRVEASPETATARAAAAVDAVAWVAQARAEAKTAAVILARRMAEKLIGHAVSVDAAVMGDIARRALAAANPGSAALVLRVHPEDLALLEGTRPGWLDAIGTKAEVTLLADPAVGRYGCVVETPGGRVDARLATQLDALERALRDVLARGE